MSRALKTRDTAPPIIDIKPSGEIVAVKTPGAGHNSKGDRMAGERLRFLTSRIQRLDAEIKALNADKSEVYQEAKAAGFDPGAVRAAIRWMNDPAGSEEKSVLVDQYVGWLQAPEAEAEGEGVDAASRARARARARGDAA